MTASASDSCALTAGGAESIRETIDALTCRLTSNGITAVEVPGTPFPLARLEFPASFSASSPGEGSHLNLTWFLNATAAAWRSSTGASVETNWGASIFFGGEVESSRPLSGSIGRRKSTLRSPSSRPPHLQQSDGVAWVVGSELERRLGLLDAFLSRASEGSEGREDESKRKRKKNECRSSPVLVAPFLSDSREQRLTGLLDSVCTNACLSVLTSGSSSIVDWS